MKDGIVFLINNTAGYNISNIKSSINKTMVVTYIQSDKQTDGLNTNVEG